MFIVVVSTMASAMHKTHSWIVKTVLSLVRGFYFCLFSYYLLLKEKRKLEEGSTEMPET